MRSLAGRLKLQVIVPDDKPACSGKELTMWVFDGEEWTEEGGSASDRKGETVLPMYDRSMPELQVIEIEQVHPTTPRTNYIPVPLP